MEDKTSADLTIRCEEKSFRVHKSVLCARSTVFRQALSDMEEGGKGEIQVPEIDENIMVSIIAYIYTGELRVNKELDIQMVVYAADKYNLPGFMELLCNKLRKEDVGVETVADMLISAYRHESEELMEVTLEKIRANKGIIKDEEFREKMKNVDPVVLLQLDLLNSL